jgi:hypothetical protein
MPHVIPPTPLGPTWHQVDPAEVYAAQRAAWRMLIEASGTLTNYQRWQTWRPKRPNRATRRRQAATQRSHP